MRGLLSSLILHDKVVTTEAKAKQLKQAVERLISRSKALDLSARRRILSFLPEKAAAEKLFARIVPQFKARIGGYVRVIKLPQRRGDNAPMARVEFVEEIKEKPAYSKRPTANVRKPKTVSRTRSKIATPPLADKPKAVSRAKRVVKNARNKTSKSKRS